MYVIQVDLPAPQDAQDFYDSIDQKYRPYLERQGPSSLIMKCKNKKKAKKVKKEFEKAVPFAKFELLKMGGG